MIADARYYLICDHDISHFTCTILVCFKIRYPLFSFYSSDFKFDSFINAAISFSTSSGTDTLPDFEIRYWPVKFHSGSSDEVESLRYFQMVDAVSP